MSWWFETALDNHETDPWIELPEVVGIRRQDLLAGTTGADNYVSVDNVGRRARRQQAPHVRRVDPVEGDDVSGRLADEPGQASLALRR